MTLLAQGEFNLIHHVSDHVWTGYYVEFLGLRITLMSSAIASMILVAVLLVAVLIAGTRFRRGGLPRGLGNAIEVLVVFVRDMIARPALHDKAYQFLPLLLTMFVFVLGMNLIGLFPIEPLFVAMGFRPIGVRPTGVPTIAAALGAISLLTIIFLGLKTAALKYHLHRNWPMWLAVPLSPLLWLRSLAPSVPGPVGKILLVPLALLELIGAIMKCFALVVRLFANMFAGHALLAVMMMFIVQALAATIRTQSAAVYYVAPFSIAASVLVQLLELLVAIIQAYIFTFLTAMFLSLYVEPAH